MKVPKMITLFLLQGVTGTGTGTDERSGAGVATGGGGRRVAAATGGMTAVIAGEPPGRRSAEIGGGSATTTDEGIWRPWTALFESLSSS
jgi:hypothetical protein